jgi:hypothetical protein
MVFVANTHAAHLFFLKDTRKKIKELQPTHRTKTHAKKNCLKLNNIMQVISPLRIFFAHAHASMPALRKKIL